MISGRMMERVIKQYENLIERQQKEIDDLRNRLAAKSYGEYVISKDREVEYIPEPMPDKPEPGTIVDGFPAR